MANIMDPSIRDMKKTAEESKQNSEIGNDKTTNKIL